MANLTKLLSQRKFAPIFFTQFTGAFNDNIFKNALIILLTFNSAILPSGISANLALNITGALLILPFFLFSAIAGQVADSYEKSKIAKQLKIAELVLIVFGCIGLATENIYLIWGVIFGLGIQAAFFGPIKYSILPQLLNDKELLGGNALIESGTFLAILLGTILGGILISVESGYIYVAILATITSVFGIVSSFYIPKAPSSLTAPSVSFNIYKETINIVKLTYGFPAIFKSILAVSWFWFLGALLLTEFPLIVKDIIGGDSAVVTAFLTIFSVGIIIGALTCEFLSKNKVEIGLVPLGSLGMIFFMVDLVLAFNSFDRLSDPTFVAFVSNRQSYRVMLDLLFLSIFGGLFTVPLYAFIQEVSPEGIRSRIISANNIFNSSFMVLSAVFTVTIFKLGGSFIDLLWCVIVLHIAITTYIYCVVPDFIARFLLWLVFATIYKVRTNANELLPNDGPALIVCNKKTSVDPFFIFAAIQRPVRFGISGIAYNKHPILFNAIGAFPVNKDEVHEAIAIANNLLAAGEIVVFMTGSINQTDYDIANSLEGIKQSYSYPVFHSEISGTDDSIFSSNNFKTKFKNIKLKKLIQLNLNV